MGKGLSKLLGSLFSRRGRESRIVILGLDNAGKTTILYRMKLGEVTNTTPTIGFNVESVTHENITFSVWDVGGQDSIRALWKHYYLNTEGVIFVIDSADRGRISEAKEELWNVLEAEELKDAALLVLANKSDLDNAMTAAEATEALELNEISNHTWHLQPSCATKGTGVDEGFSWLAGELKAKS